MTTPTTTPAKDDPFHRSSYAIKKELAPGLKDVTDRLRLSLAGMLSMLAADPVRAEQLLAPLAAEYREKMDTAPTAGAEVREQRKKARELLKNADPETLARMLAAASQPEAEQK